eukprot:TRINITY_DN16665_c0_g1_i1.p1 TRINITY_DN16665_c0_g1~~TRINITY_DN16665_c0_g1_i1.p1  ORF type:complete len:308 (-),score=55.85 TRINITY_DN16665_c0_g1_i1:252-1175(-)
MHRGNIVDWDGMELLWQHLFDKMCISSSERPILLTESPLRPKSNREKLLQLAFDCFSAPASVVALEPVLSLFACDRSSGLVLQLGEGCCTTLAVLDGYLFAPCTQTTDLAGRDLTGFLGSLLGERGYALTTRAELEIAREIKEKHCYVALDPEAEKDKAASSDALMESYTLPDGHRLLLGSERYRCPEALFQPALMGQEGLGVHELVHGAMMRADVDERRDLCGNVLLSGGCTMFPGMAERMQREMRRLVPASMRVKVVAPPERRYSVWIGGSILASMNGCKWIKREEYEEIGTAIAHRKCCGFGGD